MIYHRKDKRQKKELISGFIKANKSEGSLVLNAGDYDCVRIFNESYFTGLLFSEKE